jgi:ABC-2 type transport system permease protein
VGGVAGMSKRYRSPDADLVAWTCTVETDADQVALTPGDLVNCKVTDGRVTYRYEATATSWPPQFCSARYAVARSNWTPASGGSPVSIEVHHLPAHPWNAERFAEAARFALDELSREYGPYRGSAVRIAEVPNDAVAPTTSGSLLVIPEKAGWLHDYRQPPPFDWITFLVGRELARHWWRDRLGPADVAGASLLTDGVPSYLGLWLVARKQGPAGSRPRLAILADRYLKQRASEEQTEPSLTAADGQGYLEFKAAVGLIGLRDVAGEGAFDKALRSFFVRYDRPTDPRPTARAFADLLLSELPAQAKGVAKELFDKVVSNDIRVSSAAATNLEAGRYEVVINVEFHTTDSTGAPTLVDIAVFTKDGGNEPASVNRASLRDGMNTVRLAVADRPTKVVADPGYRLFDRNTKDNTAPVRLPD